MRSDFCVLIRKVLPFGHLVNLTVTGPRLVWRASRTVANLRDRPVNGEPRETISWGSFFAFKSVTAFRAAAGDIGRQRVGWRLDQLPRTWPWRPKVRKILFGSAGAAAAS